MYADILTLDAATARARELVLSYGWNSTAYQTLNPGISHWFDRSGRGLAGYIRRGNYMLVAGAPVCPPQLLPEVIAEFEEFAREQRCRVCYVCAGERMRAVLADSPRHSIVILGAQPAWDPRGWDSIVKLRSSLRSQLHRAANKGVRVEPIDVHEAAADPQLRRVLEEWVAFRRLPPLHFMVEPEILRGVVEDRQVLVAKQKERVVAFLVASPVGARNGFLIEELARTADAPNGTSELLIDAAMRQFAREGRTYATMGLVALARDIFRHNPLWLRSLMYFARAHANRFYNFRGLEHFRAKMLPRVWEKIYLISNERQFSPRTLYAVGGAFSGISPVRAVLLGVWKGIHEEFHSARRKRFGRSG